MEKNLVIRKLGQRFTFTVIMACVAATAPGAWAAIDSSTITDASTVVSFDAPSVLSHELTAVRGLEPKHHTGGLTLADGVVNIKGLLPGVARLALRWKNGESIPDTMEQVVRKITNNEDNTKSITVYIHDEDLATGLDYTTDPDWAIYSVKSLASEFKYSINLTGAQTVAAGSYDLSLSAAVWID